MLTIVSTDVHPHTPHDRLAPSEGVKVADTGCGDSIDRYVDILARAMARGSLVAAKHALERLCHDTYALRKHRQQILESIRWVDAAESHEAIHGRGSVFDREHFLNQEVRKQAFYPADAEVWI